ncbi:MAG: DUF4175 family protein [Verrucomicrobia bacterium]|nr:DUF4175 family protein [Verrucomicrobiota bacterium]
MSLVPDSLHAQVERYKRRAQRLTLAEGVAQTAVLFLGLLALTFLLDRWLFLPLAARVALTVTVWGATLAGFIRFILWPLRKRWGDIEVAFNVEAAFPQLNEELATAVELEASRDPDSIKGSPQLIAALVNDLARRSSTLDFASVISPKRATVSAAVAAALALGLGVYAIAATEHFLLLAKRFVNPLAALPRASTVKLAVKPGNVTIETGGSVTVRVEVFNRRVGRAVAYFAGDGQPLMRLETIATAAPVSSTPPKPGVAVALQQLEIPLPAVRSNAVYFVRAGDAESQRFRIVAQRGPRLERFTLTYRFPDYTALPPKTISAETADIAALRGTRVTVVAEASQPLSSAALEANGAPPKPAQVTGDRSVTAEIAVEHDAEFKLRITDTAGFRNADAVSYKIKALPDQPPTVKLLDPEQDVELGKPEPLELKFATTDDHGISSAYLVHNQKRDQMPVSGVAAFDLAKAGYKAGEEVVFHIEVEDNSPEHQLARSEERKVRISELADLSLRNKDFAELRKLREALARASQSASDARRGIEQLRADFGRTGQWNADLTARANALRRDLQSAQDASRAAQVIVAASVASPRTPQVLRDWENIANLLEQFDESLASARVAATALDHDTAQAAAVNPALARLATAADSAAKVSAQLDEGFTRLYDARGMEVLSQLARRVERAEQRLLEHVYGSSRHWKRKREQDAADQTTILNATKLLAAGLGMADAALPQNTALLRAAKERLTDIAQPKIESLQQWLKDGGKRGWRNRDSLDPLTESLRKTREELTTVEAASADAANAVRSQFERGRLELSQRMMTVSQSPSDQLRERIGDLIVRVDQQSEPHLTLRVGDARWGKDLLLIRDGLRTLTTGAATPAAAAQLRQLGEQLNHLERQRDLRLLVQSLRRLESQQKQVSESMDEAAAWLRLRLGELADVEREARTELAPLGDRLGALANRVAPVDGEAARQIQDVRQQFGSSQVLSRLEKAAEHAESGDREWASLAARQAQADIASLRAALERILKTRLQQAEQARAQLQQRQPSPAERVERLAKQQEALTQKTQQQAAPTREERQQQAAEQQQLRADARAVQRGLLAEAPEQPTPEQMRDLHDAALRVAETEREPMAAATEALARGQQAKAAQQQQQAAEQLRQTAQQLAAAKKGDEMVAQAEQAEALAKQQEKLLAATNTSKPAELPSQAQAQRSLAAQAQALAQAAQQSAPAASQPMAAAQSAMQEAAKALQQANQPNAAINQQAALQNLQQAALAMAAGKQVAMVEAQQARAQLQKAEQPLPNRPQLEKGYDWLKKLSEVAAKQNDVAQRAAANQPAQPLASEQSAVRQQMKSELESQPTIRADQLQQAMEKLKASAQAVAELARKEQETAGKLDQLRSDRDWRQKEAQRRAEEIARHAQRSAQQSPKQAGNFQQQAQTMQEAAEALKRGDNEAARQRIEQASKASGDQSQRLANAAKQQRAEKSKDRRVAAERAKEASQTARAANEMKQLAHLEKELARKLEEMGTGPTEQLKQLATGQEQMRGDLQQIGKELERTKSKLADLAPQVAKAIENAPEAAKNQIPEKMRSAANEMKSRNTQQASQNARSAQQDLHRIADQLTRAAAETAEKQQAAEAAAASQPLVAPPMAASALNHAGEKMEQAKGEFDKGQTQPGQQPAAEAAQSLQTLVEMSAQTQQQQLVKAMQQMAAEKAAEQMAEQAAQPMPGEEAQSLDSKLGSTGQSKAKESPAELKLRGELVNLDKLPAELQQGLMHGMREKYPPEYEQLIKKYFEKLSKASGK